MFEKWKWFRVIDSDKVRFKRRKIRVVKVGEEGPELWTSDLEAGPTLPVPRETDVKVIFSTRKMRAAGDDTLKE